MVGIQRRHRRAAAAVAAAVAVAVVSAGCGNDDTKAAASSGGASSGGASSSGGIARAQAQVAEFTANPALKVSPLPSRPETSKSAIQLNCTIPACAPGAMKPAMAALGWKFEEMPYDVLKGPSAVQAALTQAVAAGPDVIIMPGNYPLTTFQGSVDAAMKQGIKFVAISASPLPPGYAACIQCPPAAEALGALAGNIVLANAGAKTGIAVAVDKTIQPLVSEADGVKRAVKENGEGSEVLDLEQSISATPADNAAKTVSFLQRNPSVKYIVSTTPQFVAANALNSAGLGSRVKYVGVYPVSEADVAAVKDGQVVAYAVSELASLYWRATDAAARATLGVDSEDKEPVSSLRVIDKSNADVSLLEPADFQNLYKTAWKVQ